jgi:hypothetical protein
MSTFIREQIEKQVKALRYDCGLQRLMKRQAFGDRWARAGRSNAENERDSGPSDKYWDDRQAESQRKYTAAVESADKALANFIAEHRPIMGAEWIGNDHGRLCWEPYLGGLPIDQHYCQKEEGHQGNHGNEVGEWPQGATNQYEWQRLARRALQEPQRHV